MADFCTQCTLTIMLHGPDWSDFDGICKPGEQIVVLCEGCGPTVVDHRGRCVADDCPSCTAPRIREVLRSAEAWAARRRGPAGPLWRLRDWWLGTPWYPGRWHSLRHWWYTRQEEIKVRSRPRCFGSNPNPQEKMENYCDICPHQFECQQRARPRKKENT